LNNETKEEAYRRIVDCLPVCVGVGNPAGELLYVNEVGAAALGRPLYDIIGERWINYIHPDVVDLARSEWKARRYHRKNAPAQRGYRWQHLLAEPLLDNDGQVINWYLIDIEIDESVKTQEALSASAKEARELLVRLPAAS
jgi:PAS domain-containing protein